MAAAEGIRQKYARFRDLLGFNNECLEALVELQEDLRDVPPLRDVLGDRVHVIFDRAEKIVATLEKLTGKPQPTLMERLRAQRHEVETYTAACDELVTPRLSTWLSEIDSQAASEVGGKAAALGEVKNKLGLPVPDGYVLTTEAYRQFCGIPLWRAIRDAMREVDPNDLDALRAVSARLRDKVLACQIPRSIEVAITERARKLATHGLGLAVRSSAVGEGGERTFAGQFLSLINAPRDQVLDAYKRVVAGRFSERAMFYRLSTGLAEVDSPLAVLFLPVIRARAAGILYTRDPKDPKKEVLWITATRGLALDIANGAKPADLFVVSRRRPHRLVEQSIVHKQEQIVPEAEGKLAHKVLPSGESEAPSLAPEHLKLLAEWSVRIEAHFGVPQDVEWAVDEGGNCWILQSRPLVLAGTASTWAWSRPRVDPIIAGGHTVYPGRISGPAHLAKDAHDLSQIPEGSVLLMRTASPEIIEVFPRIGGLVTEWGNVAGHAATLLREFKVPSVFQMTGAIERVKPGDPISLDAGQAKIYPGNLWPPRQQEVVIPERYRNSRSDPISQRLLALHLLDPAAFNFRPRGCKSAHDVIRFCHEKAVETMFTLNQNESERGPHLCKRLLTPIPVNLRVLDLGGGLKMDDPDSPDVTPSQIVSRPFQALWKGVSHPGVTWTREMPASFSDLASVMAGALSSQNSAVRALGERSYLMVADEYMDLNSRLAYHFSLVDACVSDVPSRNYISFRFFGGGATQWRRRLRACFIEACLTHYGYLVERRGDLVNAWFKKAPTAETEARLDILGRLMACSSQLDMYMTSHQVMKWYVQQFLEGNYGFRMAEQTAARNGATVP
ncbi:MAG: PEP/pyruvate-binding domain-containing protein [Candidatus Binataceae bacterium]